MTTSLANQSTPDLNTLADPRSDSPLANGVSRSNSNSSTPHPDLSEEVAALSTKLINAINHQTNLDDELQGTRHELELAREQIRRLEELEKEHKHMLDNGLLIRKAESERKEEDLRYAIDEERRARNSAEREKRGMEQQLEDLTSSLFEEANTMVSTARMETEASEKRAEGISAKLKDTETLLISHQEQLRDLKTVLAQVQSEELVHNDVSATAPSTPTKEGFARASRDAVRGHSARQSTASNFAVLPEPPLRYTHLIQPVLRHDLQAYEDFLYILKISNVTTPTSRNTSGNFSGLNVMGLGFKSSDATQSSVMPPHHHQSNSNSSLSTGSNHSTPIIPSTTFTTSSPSENNQNLKDTKFYKRILVEDIEPTLRLETAPGLSFFARRAVLNSMLAGNLIVEPYAPRKLYLSPAYSCTLCGEVRMNEEHGRKHRFRTNDSEDAQQYPLCDYCLQRLRAACDFVGFLRACKAGLWRGGGSGNVEIEGKAAWEESVRLRERMVWARIGGGVVPNVVSSHDVASPVISPTAVRDSMRANGIAASDSPTDGQPKSRSRDRSATIVPAHEISPPALASAITPTPASEPTSADDMVPAPLRVTELPQLDLTKPTPLDTEPPSTTPLSMPLSAYNCNSSTTSLQTTASAPGVAPHVSTQLRTESPTPRPSTATPIAAAASTATAPQKLNRVAALASRFQDVTNTTSPSSSSTTTITQRRGSQASISSREPGSPERRSPERRSPERRSPERSLPGSFT